MKRMRGFKLKHRVATLFRFVSWRSRTFSRYHRLDPPTAKCRPFSRLFSCLRTKIKSLCPHIPGRTIQSIPDRGYLALDDDGGRRQVAVPKGHLAVYVGQDGGDFHRFLVPVIYFNHPLFGELLREAEEKFGFNHPGGITIPCRVSDFESVQSRIAATRGGRRLLSWRKVQ